MRPIISSTDMVKAILEGRETQMRRIIKPQPIIPGHYPPFKKGRMVAYYENHYTAKEGLIADFCPYQTGQILWVRETWAYQELYTIDERPDWINYVYKADSPEPTGIMENGNHQFLCRKKPAVYFSK